MTDREAYVARNRIKAIGPVTLRAMIDALGMVGSRKCTSYELSTADRRAYQLA